MSAGFAAPARGITPQQAQTMPLPVLAKQVLGDIGDDMVAVDRPRSDCGPFACGPEVTPGSLNWPTIMTFHSRPETWRVVGESLLCQSQSILVSYDPHGRLVGRPTTGWTFKTIPLPTVFARPFVSDVSDANQESAADRQERVARDARCSSQSTNGFFPAEDVLTASYGVEAIGAIRALLTGRGKPAALACVEATFATGDCHKAALSALHVAAISDVLTVPCDRMRAFRLPDRALCLQLYLNRSMMSADTVSVAMVVDGVGNATLAAAGIGLRNMIVR